MADPILNTDAGEILARIANALTFYARTLPNAAVPQVQFQQTPLEDTRWQASVQLRCLGDIKSPKREVPSDKFLDGAVPTTVYDKTWTADGEGFAGAVVELASVVHQHLEKTVGSQRDALSAVEEALSTMNAPIDNLSTMWRTEDHPDDNSEEG